MSDAANITIEVAFALPERQHVQVMTVPSGCTAREAVVRSELPQLFPQFDFASCQLGVFGQVVTDDRLLCAGERLEVYRPLATNPRDARRMAASAGKTIGREH